MHIVFQNQLFVSQIQTTVEAGKYLEGCSADLDQDRGHGQSIHVIRATIELFAERFDLCDLCLIVLGDHGNG